MYTPEKIISLNEKEVFVFGTNQYASHAGGAAVIAAEKFGALNGISPHGLCGQSYGIITTSFNDMPVSLDFIKQQLLVLYEFATLRPDLVFLVTKIATGIAGFSITEVAELFHDIGNWRPSNI
ncbi:MAG: hypothetical protein ABL876_19705, partial [Chitinophagaceae bacterium]